MDLNYTIIQSYLTHHDKKMLVENDIYKNDKISNHQTHNEKYGLW